MDNEKFFYAFLAIFILLGVSFISAAPLAATVNNPTNDTWNASNDQIQFFFTCGSNSTYHADSNVSYNASLWFSKNGGAWTRNATHDPMNLQNDTLYNITVPAIEDTALIEWFVTCENWSVKAVFAVNASFNTSTQTLKVDATAPDGGSIETPRTTTIWTQRPIKFSCSGSDSTSGIDYIKLKITKPSGRTVEKSLSSGEEITFLGVDTGELGSYSVECTLYDIAGNSLDTEDSKFNVYNRVVKSSEPTEEPEEEVEEEGPTEGVPTTPSAPEKAPSKAWIWVVVGVVVIGIVYFVLKKK